MPSDVLMAEAILGQDAQDFLNTELGRYIVGRAQQERDDALRLLASVSPWRRNRIRQLQNVVWRADSMGSWLADLITSGKQAEAVLETDQE